MKPDHRQRVLSQCLTAAGDVAGELARDMLAIAVGVFQVPEDQRTIAGERG
jgi:hypothetical protein